MNSTVIPPAWWVLMDESSLESRLVHLYLISIMDRDGLARLDSLAISKATGIDQRRVLGRVWGLADAGLIATYEPNGSWFAWSPHVAEWNPRSGSLSRCRDLSIPAPEKEKVIQTLEILWGRKPTTKEARAACPRAWGRVRPATGGTPPDRDSVSVWEAWRDRQDRPSACVFGPGARKLVTAALKEAPAHHLIVLVNYAYEADEPGPRFWRGHNDRRRTYLGLDNLLVVSKLSARIQHALEWVESLDPDEEGDGTDLGPMSKYRRTGPRGTTTSPDPRPERLSNQCQQMLTLFLQRQDQGVTTAELAQIALKYSARVSELRGAGADIVCVERSADGNNLYAMKNAEVWGTHGLD
jgi:hypothetical protein